MFVYPLSCQDASWLQPGLFIFSWQVDAGIHIVQESFVVVQEQAESEGPQDDEDTFPLVVPSPMQRSLYVLLLQREGESELRRLCPWEVEMRRARSRSSVPLLMNQWVTIVGHQLQRGTRHGSPSIRRRRYCEDRSAGAWGILPGLKRTLKLWVAMDAQLLSWGGKSNSCLTCASSLSAPLRSISQEIS